MRVRINDIINATAKVNDTLNVRVSIADVVTATVRDTSENPFVTVVIYVLSSKTAEPIPGATVALGGVEKTTDSEGKVSYKVVKASYVLDIEADGYNSFTGVVNIITNSTFYQALTPSTVEVTYHVVDDLGANFAGVPVTLNGVTQNTNASGNTTFTIAPGTYPYSIAATNYITQSGSVVISGTTTIEIAMLWSFELDSTIWLGKVIANGGTCNYTMYKNQDLSVKADIANGDRGTKVRQNNFWGDQLAAALVPIYTSKTPGVTVGNAIDVRAGTTLLSSYAVNAGITGNGSGYLNTGVVPSATSELGQNTAGHFVAIKQFFDTVNVPYFFGSQNATSSFSMRTIAIQSLSYYSSTVNNVVNVPYSTAINSALLMMLRVSSSQVTPYKNGEKGTTTTANSVGEVDRELYVFGTNLISSANYTKSTIASYGINDSIANDTQAIRISNTVNALMTTNNRNTY
jgi:hypothetical protein